MGMPRISSATHVAAALFHRRKHGRSRTAATRGELSGTRSFVDPTVDGSIRGLLESTFSPTAHGRSQVFMPLPMNAISETLRERRDNQNGGGGGNSSMTGRNPFSSTMPSHFGGGSGRHARGVSTSAVDTRVGGGGRFAQTLGSLDVARHWLKSDPVEIETTGILSESTQREGGGRERGGVGDAEAAVGDNESDEWDPFVSGISASTVTATAASKGAPAIGQSNPNDEDNSSTGHRRRRSSAALHRMKSRKQMQAGGLSGRDPREAAKRMAKAPVFVEVDKEGEPTTRESQHHQHIHMPRLQLHQLGRRKSDHGMTTMPTPPSSTAFSSTTIFRRFSRSGSPTNNATIAREEAAASSATEGQKEPRRRSSMSETTTGPDAVKAGSVASDSTSGGGFAFSCDAKAQRAEIAMILGTRASPTPRTASFLARQRSSTQVRAATAALEGASEGGGGVDEGDDVSSGGVDAVGVGKELPPLQRRPSGITAAAAAASATNSGPTRGVSSQRILGVPSDVMEEEEMGRGREGETKTEGYC